jgi:hypothetical protein
MQKKDNKKKTSIITPFLWVFTTVIWTVTVYRNINTDGVSGYLIALQCCTIIVSFGAAIANFIRYKRSRNNKSE